MSQRWVIFVLIPHVLLITLLCLIPMLLMFGYVSPGGTAPTPLGIAELLWSLLGDPFYLVVIVRTVGLALGAALLAVVLSYPVAATMALMRGRWQTLAVALTLLPLLTDLNVRTLGQIILYGRRGFASHFLQGIGLSDGPVSILGTPLAVLLGMTQSYAPFAVLAIFAVLKSQEAALLEAANTLGAGKLRAFMSVTLPLSLPGAGAGAVIVFLLSLSSFVIPSILGSGQVLVLSVLIYQRALMLLDWRTATGLAVILLVIAFVFVWGAGRLTERAEMVNSFTMETARPTSRYQILVSRLPDIAWPPAMTWILVATIGLFILSPLILLLIAAFNAGPATEFPPSRYGLAAFERLAASTGYLESFIVSLKVAAIAVLIAIPIGFLGSLGASRLPKRWRGSALTYLLLPLMVPHVVLGIALLRYANLTATSGTIFALVATHLLITLPYIARSVTGSLGAIRPVTEEAALTLGASRWQVIRNVVFPLVRPGMAVGALFAFVMSFTDIILSVFMSSAQIIPMPVRIYSQLQDGYDLGLIAALSVIFVLFAAASVYLIDRLIGLSEFSIA